LVSVVHRQADLNVEDGVGVAATISGSGRRLYDSVLDLCQNCVSFGIVRDILGHH
jgi:hypothetical protein